jgi:hypothetical protein
MTQIPVDACYEVWLYVGTLETWQLSYTPTHCLLPIIRDVELEVLQPNTEELETLVQNS